MTALAMACRLILYCHGSHVADVTQAIDDVCRRDRECTAAHVVTVHNETRWYLSESAVRFSPWGLVAAAHSGAWVPGTPYRTAATIATGILRHGLRRCRSWPRAFAWYIRGEQHGRCPHVGPESRQRWQQMRRLLRRQRGER